MIPWGKVRPHLGRFLQRNIYRNILKDLLLEIRLAKKVKTYVLKVKKLKLMLTYKGLYGEKFLKQFA